MLRSISDTMQKYIDRQVEVYKTGSSAKIQCSNREEQSLVRCYLAECFSGIKDHTPIDDGHGIYVRGAQYSTVFNRGDGVTLAVWC